MYDLEQLRQQEFPISQEVIYFNHASISPIPQRSLHKMQWASQRLAAHPSHHFMQDGLPLFEAFGKDFAAFINAKDPQEIVPISSTSQGLNLIAQALPLQAGENIAFCEIEFPSNAYPWMSLEREGIEARKVPAINGGLTLEALAKSVDSKTRVVAASAVQFFTGHRSDLAAIGAFCREKGIWFVVDAIQAIGHMPFDVQAMNIDVLATGGQKSLLAPPGIGFMYVRNSLAERLTPRSIFPNATRNWIFWLDYDITPLEGAARFMGGTPNLVGMFAALESLHLIQELGVEQIDAHTSALVAEGMEMMAKLGYEPITAREEHSAILTCKTGPKGDELVSYLDQQGISVVKHLSPKGESHVRLSFHCYNTKDELSQFEAIIKDFGI